MELILEHFIEFDELDFSPKKKYLDLYNDCDEKLKMLFVYFHQNLNELLEYMNGRGAGAHYTANESRELIYLIDKIKELKMLLENSKFSFNIDSSYVEWMNKCDSFLSQSGGSEIPSDYKRVIPKNYEKIFTLTDQLSSSVKASHRIKYIMKGEGAFAKVFAYSEPLSGKKFALKKLNKDIVGKELERFKLEFEKMNSINNPYILKAYSYDNETNSYIMEYCDYTLKEFVETNNNKPFMDEKYRKSIALQFLRGLKYLHSKDLLHRDLSLNNILIKQYDDQFIVVKISDFGLVKDINLDLTSTDSEIRGTIIDDTLTSFKDYNIKNEIYAVGIILWFIFTGKRNLSKIDNSKIGNIVKKCVDRDHNKRYENIDEIIKDIVNIEIDKNNKVQKDDTGLKKNATFSQTVSPEYGIDKYGIDFIIAMAEDTKDNHLIYSHDLIGERFQTTDGKFIIELSTKPNREQVYIKESFNKLLLDKYIKSLNRDNSLFELTAKGYKVYDSFKQNGVLHLENK